MDLGFFLSGWALADGGPPYSGGGAYDCSSRLVFKFKIEYMRFEAWDTMHIMTLEVRDEVCGQTLEWLFVEVSFCGCRKRPRPYC